MTETIEDLKKQIETLKKELSLYKTDARFRGYYIQNKMANQQINVIDEFDLGIEIKKTTKDDKYYDRAKGLWEGMPDMISGLNKLRIELKITGDEDKDSKNVPFIERIATKRD